jgi:hypothetical protein
MNYVMNWLAFLLQMNVFHVMKELNVYLLFREPQA